MDLAGEGVETEAQRTLLSRSGCRELQGYLFSPPVADEKFAAFLTHHKTYGVGRVRAGFQRTRIGNASINFGA